jgi:hypothetical protein
MIRPKDQHIKGRVYRIHCRNLSYGVYDGNSGFIGIRLKFYDRFLFTEYHYDAEAYGTVRESKDTGIDVPEYISLRTSLGSVDQKTQRPVDFDKPIADGGRGWYFLDTNEASEDIRPAAVSNRRLFKFLDTIAERLGDESNVDWDLRQEEKE